ncbi:hypothetical protein CUJ84_pRLN3000344 (plasmid) [Rhizobium leguminosarum]|uniref:Uncharacterized protein n=1 Tax=Rhizobium leguminosarum TaxID=384 RepID=A0A2K9ZGS4_RHILE|nr:hypothetical protein CUJ84_pRLN3000344 [Rhizobium leguminosarum]
MLLKMPTICSSVKRLRLPGGLWGLDKTPADRSERERYNFRPGDIFGAGGTGRQNNDTIALNTPA